MSKAIKLEATVLDALIYEKLYFKGFFMKNYSKTMFFICCNFRGDAIK